MRLAVHGHSLLSLVAVGVVVGLGGTDREDSIFDVFVYAGWWYVVVSLERALSVPEGD